MPRPIEGEEDSAARNQPPSSPAKPAPSAVGIKQAARPAPADSRPGEASVASISPSQAPPAAKTTPPSQPVKDAGPAAQTTAVDAAATEETSTRRRSVERSREFEMGQAAVALKGKARAAASVAGGVFLTNDEYQKMRNWVAHLEAKVDAQQKVIDNMEMSA